MPIPSFHTDVRAFNGKIFFRGYDKKGKRVQGKLNYKPSLFIPANKKTEYTTIEGKHLDRIDFGSIDDAKEFVNQYKGIDNFEFFGNTNWEYAFISDMYRGKSAPWRKEHLRICNIDIEVNSSNGFPQPDQACEKVTSICMKCDDTYFVFSYGDYKIDPNDKRNIRYIRYKSEYELLRGFLLRYQEFDPDIITGWNIEGFDVPYLYNRIKNIMGEAFAKSLSPWNMVHTREVPDKYGKKKTVYKLVGVSVIDYMNTYKKFVLKAQESYALDHIAYVELGEKKLSYEEHKNLHTLYENDFQKFIDYNIRDVELVDEIDNKRKLIDLVLTLAYMAGINLEDPFHQTRIWDALIYNRMKQDGVQVPQKKSKEKAGKYKGAFVKPPIPGFKKWIASFDLNSLYPHLIMEWNISPEMLVDYKDYTPEMQKLASEVSVAGLLKERYDLSYLKENDICMSVNAHFFKTEKRGFLPQMMEELYTRRKKVKKEMLAAQQKAQDATDKKEKERWEEEAKMLDLLQQGLKVTLNSAYGALGNEYFRFYDTRMAEAITYGGRFAIQWSEKTINNFMNDYLETTGVDYVPYIDTDSNYVSLEGVIKKHFPDGVAKEKVKEAIDIMDQFCVDELEPAIENGYERLRDYVNGIDQKMVMGREVLADIGLWRKKKNYALRVYDNEGVVYKEPKIKIVGLECVKSDTAEVCRDAIEDCIKLILDEDVEAARKYTEEFKEKFLNMEISKIASPKGVNYLEKYADPWEVYIKGTQGHIRSALIHNRLVEINDLENTIETIKSGDKIKYVWLNTPNPIHDNIVGFKNDLPEEFGLHKYVDYEKQFHDNYYGSIKSIFNAVGWDMVHQDTLEDIMFD